MQRDNGGHDDKSVHPVWGPVVLLGFGLFVLAFLIAIDRPHWFSIKPVTGTAAAMSFAGESESHRRSSNAT